jgi:RNA polymerase sigma factor (sigma-70 family)
MVTVRTFEDLIEAHGREILAYAIRLTGDRDEADDLFQETFLAAFRAFAAARDDNLRAWLYRIATNKATDARRRRDRRVRLDDLELAAPQHDGVTTADLAAAIKALPARERAAFVLRRVQDLTYADVARALDCTEEAARKRVSEATKKVKEAVA